MDNKSGVIILKLGGSVISHSNKLIDFSYLREFRDLLQEQVLLGRKFIVVVGGGQLVRNYLDYSKSQGNISLERDLHWIGVAGNTLNAEVIRGFLGDDLAEAHVWKYDDLYKLPQQEFNKPIAVAGGFLAGRSSDWVALQIAQALGVIKIFDLKNTDGVYSSDPRIDSKAKFLSKITWDEYLEIIGNPQEHKPGANYPVDVIAAREAKEIGAKYYIIKASDFVNIEKAINNEEYKGTLISDN